MINGSVVMSYLHTKFHENRISSFTGVAMTIFWDGRTDRQTDGQTDRVTALIDLLSPLATHVKMKYDINGGISIKRKICFVVIRK